MLTFEIYRNKLRKYQASKEKNQWTSLAYIILILSGFQLYNQIN